jgi:hypothetical protein
VDDDGKTVASWVNYGCHPTILTGDNFHWSTDWPGVLCNRLEEEWGGIAGFYNGCHGDVGPHRPERNFAEVERIGGGLAEVTIALGKDMAFGTPSTLAARSVQVSVPLDDPPSDDELREKAGGSDGAGYEGPWAADQLRLRAEGVPIARDARMEVQGFRIGDLGLACFPGQLFGGWGLDLRSRWGHERLMVVNQANDHAGYFPTEVGWERGGYEVRSAFMFNSDLPAPMTWEAGKRLADVAVEMFASMP